MYKYLFFMKFLFLRQINMIVVGKPYIHILVKLCILYVLIKMMIIIMMLRETLLITYIIIIMSLCRFIIIPLYVSE
jgi:hypothetical protein